jgi:colicin import membrane protein
MHKQTLLTILLLTACSLVSASDAGTSFLKCAQIKKSEMRLACYDKVARELAQNSPPQSGPQSKFSEAEKAQIDADLESAYWALKKRYAEMAMRIAELDASQPEKVDPSGQGAESDHRLELNRLRERLRKEQLTRLDALETGTAKQSSLTEIYASKVVAAIRPNIIFTSVIAGNPTAEVEVTTLPNGEILSRKLVRSSGNSEWDTAVLRAIDRTQRLPRDEDGRAPSPIIIAFLPEK